VRTAWTDTGYKNAVVEHGTTLGIDVETVRRDPATRGFLAQSRRWVVERPFDRLMHHRRPAPDHEALPARSEAMVHVAMTNLMTRRLTGGPTPTRRGT
ncbi:IS5 family transposase, partial [Kitasatospora cineracea]